MQNLTLSSLTMPWKYHQGQRKHSESLLTILRNGTQQLRWHRLRSSRKQQVCWFPLHYQQYLTKSRSQSNQHIGITIFNQKGYTNCRVLRSHSGALHVYQTSRCGNPQNDPGTWSRSDYLLKQTPQNEKKTSSETTLSGFPLLRIIPQYRHKSSEK